MSAMPKRTNAMLTNWLLVRPSAVLRGSARKNSMANRPMPYRMRYMPDMAGGWKKDFFPAGLRLR